MPKDNKKVTKGKNKNIELVNKANTKDNTSTDSMITLLNNVNQLSLSDRQREPINDNNVFYELDKQLKENYQPLDNLTNSRPFLTGNESKCRNYSPLITPIEEPFVFVGTSMLGAVNHALNFTHKPLDSSEITLVPKIIIVDISGGVHFLWKQLKEYFKDYFDSHDLDNINDEQFTDDF